MTGELGPSNRRPPQYSNIHDQIDDDVLSPPSFLFEEVMRGDLGPSDHRPPQDPNLQAPIDDDDAWRRQDPRSQPTISYIPPAFFPVPPSRQPRLDLNSQPSIAAAVSSLSDPPGHCPPQDAINQPPVSAAPAPPEPLVIHGEDFRALESLESGSRRPIVISPHFPLNLLILLEATISAEVKRPPESRRFEVTNPDTLGQLRQNFANLVARGQALDHHDKRCRILVGEMHGIRRRIASLKGISVQGIDFQIAAVNAALFKLNLERDLVRRQCGQ